MTNYDSRCFLLLLLAFTHVQVSRCELPSISASAAPACADQLSELRFPDAIVRSTQVIQQWATTFPNLRLLEVDALELCTGPALTLQPCGWGKVVVQRRTELEHLELLPSAIECVQFRWEVDSNIRGNGTVYPERSPTCMLVQTQASFSSAVNWLHRAQGLLADRPGWQATQGILVRVDPKQGMECDSCLLQLLGALQPMQEHVHVLQLGSSVSEAWVEKCRQMLPRLMRPIERLPPKHWCYGYGKAMKNP